MTFIFLVGEQSLIIRCLPAISEQREVHCGNKVINFVILISPYSITIQTLVSQERATLDLKKNACRTRRERLRMGSANLRESSFFTTQVYVIFLFPQKYFRPRVSLYVYIYIKKSPPKCGGDWRKRVWGCKKS